MSGDAAWSRLLLRERLIILLAVAGITALSWLYLVRLGRGMPDMSDMTIPMPSRWTPAVFVLTFAMWMVMMVGMMLPSATPLILTFAALRRREPQATARWLAPVLFASGYLLTWGGFSLLATLLQWALDELALLSMTGATNTLLGGTLFLLAGAYQLTPLKHSCLRNCRSPFGSLFNCWRNGPGGALRMGMEHGASCVGCCWPLMLLLFAVGVMNLLWVAALTLFVLGEKLLPGAGYLARASGIAMAGYGIWLIAQAL